MKCVAFVACFLAFLSSCVTDKIVSKWQALDGWMSFYLEQAESYVFYSYRLKELVEGEGSMKVGLKKLSGPSGSSFGVEYVT